MTDPEKAYRRFRRLVAQKEDPLDLVEAGLLVAAALGSPVDPDYCRGEVERIAERVHVRLQEEEIYEPSTRVLEVIEALNIVFFMEEGFRGNSEDYYDPSNSFLDQVLIRRTGIPITMSLLYMEVARAVGLPLHGIGLPGHFVVGYWWNMSDALPLYIIDAFDGGRLLSAEECVEMVRELRGPSPEHVDWFQPMPAEGILTRMLNNLRQVYTSLSDVKKLSVVADMLRALNPTRMSDLHEQAFLSYRNGDFGQALEHIERYLESSHDSEDRLRMQYYQRLFQRLSVSHN